MENICYICGTSFSGQLNPSGEDILCKSCKEIVKLNAKKKDYNATQVKVALKNAVHFEKKDGHRYFLCYYTGIPCDINPGSKDDSSSIKNAFNLTFDHKEPSIGGVKGEELVVCLNIINQVKSNISADVFKDFIILLADRFNNNIDSKKLETELKKLFLIILFFGTPVNHSLRLII